MVVLLLHRTESQVDYLPRHILQEGPFLLYHQVYLTPCQILTKITIARIATAPLCLLRGSKHMQAVCPIIFLQSIQMLYPPQK